MAVRLWRIELWWNWEEGGFIEKVADGRLCVAAGCQVAAEEVEWKEKNCEGIRADKHAGTAAACRKCKCTVNKNMQRTVGIGLNIPCLPFHILSLSPAARRLDSTNLEETRN